MAETCTYLPVADAGAWSCPLCRDTGKVVVTLADDTQVTVECSVQCVRQNRPVTDASGSDPTG